MLGSVERRWIKWKRNNVWLWGKWSYKWDLPVSGVFLVICLGFTVCFSFLLTRSKKHGVRKKMMCVDWPGEAKVSMRPASGRKGHRSLRAQCCAIRALEEGSPIHWAEGRGKSHHLWKMPGCRTFRIRTAPQWTSFLNVRTMMSVALLPPGSRSSLLPHTLYWHLRLCFSLPTFTSTHALPVNTALTCFFSPLLKQDYHCHIIFIPQWVMDDHLPEQWQISSSWTKFCLFAWEPGVHVQVSICFLCFVTPQTLHWLQMISTALIT